MGDCRLSTRAAEFCSSLKPLAIPAHGDVEPSVILIRSHDALFALVFGTAEQAAELLRCHLPASTAAAMDWSSLRRVEASFVGRDLTKRHADLLFTVLMGGRPVLLHVILEHKSGSDRFTVLQLLRYRVRVWDRWQQDHPESTALPPVLTLVVHHGAAPWSAPRTLRELVDLGEVPAVVADFVLAQQVEAPFLLLDIAALSEAELSDLRLSVVADLTLRFLQFLRTRSVDEAAGDIARWQDAMQALLEHPRGHEVLAALFSWLLAGVPQRDEALRTVLAAVDDRSTRQTMKSMLDDLLEQGFARGLAKGHQEGRQEGHHEGRRDGLLAALLGVCEARFGAVPAPVLVRFQGADEAALAAWTIRAATAASLDHVFAHG